MRKRHAKAAREGEEKPFGVSVVIGGSAVNENHGQLRRQGHGTAPLTNQVLDSLEGYLDNIAAAATQTVAKGGSLAEVAASLAISVDTVAQQQQEIKRLYRHINTLKKRGTQDSNIGTMAGGGLVGTVYTYCAAVESTMPHKNNSCYFDPENMTDQRKWDQKLMDEKGVVCKDDK